MNGVIIFDISNDIIFKTLNNALLAKIGEIGFLQQLVGKDSIMLEVNNDVLMQIFSPIINSQRIMFSQFDNTYASIQCHEGLNFAFDEFLGYLFMKIGETSVEILHRDLGVYITFARHVCGADLSTLKGSNFKSSLLLDLIETWDVNCKSDQGLLLGAVERLNVGFDLRNITSKALESASEIIKDNLHSLKSHAVIFVGSKFLDSFSSREAAKISSSDMLFLSILCTGFHAKGTDKLNNSKSVLLFLQGKTSSGLSECVPYVVYISTFESGISLIILIEHSAAQVASNICEVFSALHRIRNLQIQGDLENLKSFFDKLDFFTKQTLEALKKSKQTCQEVEKTTKKFLCKWEILKKKYIEFFKNAAMDTVIKIESNIPAFTDELKDILKVFCMHTETLPYDEKISVITTFIEEKLLEFSEFLCVRAQRNAFISSYLEEFPGLVHFIYVDRTLGFITTSDIENNNQVIPKHKIWNMVEISRSYIAKGHTASIWKDTMFNYSHFVWFEDPTGTIVRPRDFSSYNNGNVSGKLQCEGGTTSGDFYQRLCAQYFPKTPSNKIKCQELYCVHLGLVTATCVLEHSRRLAATISDVTINF